MAQRVQFLEAKGLTGPEIEEALRQASSSRPLPSHVQQPQYGPVYGPLPYVPQLNPPWDWRDYFVRAAIISFTPIELMDKRQITAVVSGSLAYGAIALARVRIHWLNVLALIFICMIRSIFSRISNRRLPLPTRKIGMRSPPSLTRRKLF